MSNESPFFIQQTAMITPNQSFSLSLLDNLARMKWKLHEIRLTAIGVDSNGEPCNSFDAAGAGPLTPGVVRIFGLASVIDFGLRLQSTYCTVPKHVPAELLRSPFFDSLSEPEDPTASVVVTLNETPAPQRAIIWTLPEPLFVPPGAKMYAELAFNAAQGANSFLWQAVNGQATSCAAIKVQVTLIGRRAENEDAPEVSCIPYVTTFRTPKLAIGDSGQVQEFEGQDFQLANHCNEDVFVQRITAYNVAAARFPTSVRYSTSHGKYLNRELAPLLELHSNGALDLSTVLKKNEWIAVEGVIDSTPAREESNPNLAAGYEQQAMFGLVGYREVPTKVLWGPNFFDQITGRPVFALRKPSVLPHLVDLKPPTTRPYNPALPWPKKG